MIYSWPCNFQLISFSVGSGLVQPTFSNSLVVDALASHNPQPNCCSLRSFQGSAVVDPSMVQLLVPFNSISPTGTYLVGRRVNKAFALMLAYLAFSKKSSSILCTRCIQIARTQTRVKKLHIAAKRVFSKVERLATLSAKSHMLRDCISNRQLAMF